MVAVGAEQLEVERVVGLALDLHAIAAETGRLRPIRTDLVVDAGDVLEDDDLLAVDDAAHLEVQTGDRALLDRAAVDVERLGRGEALVELLDAVELEAESGGDLVYDAAPGHREDAGLQQHRYVVHRHAEAHDVEHDHALVVGVVVEHLGAADLVDALTDAGQRQRQPVVGEAGIDAVDVQRRTACLARLLHTLGHVLGRTRGELQEHRSARDDVDASGEQLLEVGDRLHETVVGHRAVDDAVGLEREDLVDVVGGEDAEVLAESGELTRVLADLVRVGHPEADELEIGSGVDAGEGVATDIAGAPLDNAQLAHSGAPRSGKPMSRLGWSMPPSTSNTLPVR